MRIERILAQTLVGPWLDFETQPCYQGHGDIAVKWVSNAVINIGLVTLPFDSGPKLAVG